jgi:hypothetical protein
MMTPEGHEFASELTHEPDEAVLSIVGRRACDCGCCLPDRIEITLHGHMVFLTNPEAVDAAVAMLQSLRVKLWGEP